MGDVSHMVVAGGGGFLGRALIDALARQGHVVTVLTRSAVAPADSHTVGRGTPDHASPSARSSLPDSGTVAPAVRSASWTPDGTSGPWARALAGADAVVNLAGASLADGRWSAARKRQILDSRVLSTRSLVAAMATVEPAPAVFVSSSAVGFYGPCGDERVTEATRPGSDFLAQVCEAWEAEAWRGESPATRVVTTRTGVVLGRDGGALAPLLLPFRLGLGGPMGSGRQYWPWIHQADWIGAVCACLDRPALRGPVNLTAPQPVTNREFVAALGRALARPAWLPAPGIALRLLLGEMAQALILSGQRALPEQLERAGYRFQFPQLADALRDLLSTPT